ncbi:MAG: M23 family metallopeptidase [Eubacteriales bacterium]|nr:M23 family metallopeptidase [Eubacteriales bacterium]
MAVKEKIIATVVRTAVDVVIDEEKRKKLIYAGAISLISFLVIISFIIQILTSPLDFLAKKFEWSEEKTAEMEEIKNAMTDKFPLENIGNIGDIKKVGKYPYPLVGDFVVTSGFGFRRFLLDGRMVSDHHNGVDLVGKWHTPIISIEDGVVVFSGKQRGYGNCIMIQHDNFYSFYAHLSKRYAVVDQVVKQYDIIGLEGGAKSDDGHGTSTGHHLHFEIRMDGTKKTVVNPLPYLTDEKKDAEEESETK